VVIADDGIILDWCLHESWRLGSSPNALAMGRVLVDVQVVCDRKKIATLKITGSRRNAGIDSGETAATQAKVQ
jgi:hypothetical protein